MITFIEEFFPLLMKKEPDLIDIQNQGLVFQQLFTGTPKLCPIEKPDSGYALGFSFIVKQPSQLGPCFDEFNDWFVDDSGLSQLHPMVGKAVRDLRTELLVESFVSDDVTESLIGYRCKSIQGTNVWIGGVARVNSRALVIDGCAGNNSMDFVFASGDSVDTIAPLFIQQLRMLKQINETDLVMRQQPTGTLQ